MTRRTRPLLGLSVLVTLRLLAVAVTGLAAAVRLVNLDRHSRHAERAIVLMQAPRKFVYECDTSSSGYWRWTMTLEPIAGGTRLRHKSEGVRVPGWFRVVQPLMFPFVGKKMQVNGLNNIKARVEAGGGKAAA